MILDRLSTSTAARALAFAVLLIAAGSRTDSVAAEQQGQPDRPPRFRTEVPTVLVDVLVLDAEGRPVRDLRREDFQVFEDGVRQEIVNFDVVDWASYVSQTAPRGDVPAVDPVAASTNTFPRRFVFVVNRQGASFRSLVRARRALERFVVESMADGDEAMVIDIGNAARVLQDLRASKQETLETIRRLRPMRVDVFAGSDIAVRNVYETLESVGAALAAWPGRKIVLLLSMELDHDPSLLPYLNEAVEALNRSNTTVYALDIQDLLSGPAPARGRYDIGGLYPLATETGGRFFYNLTSFEPIVDRIGVENQRYYLLGYVPTNARFDGSFRRIEVRVDRPGVEVLARPGYVAAPRETAPATTETAAGEDEPPPAPHRPAPRGPGEVELATYLLPAADGRVDVPITVRLPADLVTGPATLRLTVTDGEGRTVSRHEETVGPDHRSLVRNALLDPGLYLLQITLEVDGRRLYQASTPIEAPARFGERFGLSSIVPVEPPAGDAPLELRPSPSLPRGEDAFLYCRVFAGERAGGKARVAFTVFRGEEPVRTGELPDALALAEGPEGAPLLVRVPFAELPPGAYRVELRLTADGRRAVGEIELRVE